MPRLFLGNFDFEHQLSTPARQTYVCTHHLAGINADLVWTWLSIADQGDALLFPTTSPAATQALRESQPVLSHFFSELGLSDLQLVTDVRQLTTQNWELVPWGWSAHLVRWAETHRLQPASPPVEVVRQVNSREFSWHWESQWNVGLPTARRLTSLADLEVAVRELRDAAADPEVPWVIKANWGMSGRERCLGRGCTITPAVQNWLRARLQRDQVALFEPWVERLAEVGIQMEIPRTGMPQCVGITPLLSDRQGAYRGSRLTLTPEEERLWQPAVDTALAAAREMQQLGYWGPVGIDAMRYQPAAGPPRLRPLQDINARYTMGRLALGWRRLLGPDEHALWLHPPPSVRAGLAEFLNAHPQANDPATATRVLATTPELPQNPPRHQTCLVITSSQQLVADLAHRITGLENHAL